jgi:hypothetical protein
VTFTVKPHAGFLPGIIGKRPTDIIIGGDIFDQAQFNSHPTSMDETVEEFDSEMQRMRAWLELLHESTSANIVIVRGNHDDRLYRQLSELLPKSLLKFFSDPLDVLIAGLPRIEVVRDDLYANRPGMAKEIIGHVRHLYVLGDAIISHAHFGSAEDFYYKWLVKWHRFLGWPEMGVVVQHHTHSFSHKLCEGGHLTLLDAGMTAQASVESYKVGASGKWKPGTLAAVYFEQNKSGDQWLSDHRSVKIIWPD